MIDVGGQDRSPAPDLVAHEPRAARVVETDSGIYRAVRRLAERHFCERHPEAGPRPLDVDLGTCSHRYSLRRHYPDQVNGRPHTGALSARSLRAPDWPSLPPR